MSAEILNGVLVIAVFLGAIVQGFSGFAFSAVVGAVLLQVQAPDLAIPLLMLCSLFIQAFALMHLRTAIPWRASLRYLAGGGAGVVLAGIVFDRIDPHALRLVLGSFLLLYGAWMLLRPQPALLGQRARPIGNTAVGFAGGLIGGLTTMPGTVFEMQCDASAMSKAAQRGVVQPFIATMQTLALVFLFLKAPASHGDLWRHLPIALPALLAGTLLGLHLYNKVGDVGFRKTVCGLLLLSGIALLR